MRQPLSLPIKSFASCFVPPSASTALSSSSLFASSSSSSFFPSPSFAAKLFFTGATVGPIVDSLHNQCLLRYHVAPISIPWPVQPLLPANLPPVPIDDYYYQQQQQPSLLFASSWVVPPLLGFAYGVLGAILPQLCQALLERLGQTRNTVTAALISSSSDSNGKEMNNVRMDHPASVVDSRQFRFTAIVAVLTTAGIIKLSDYLETHPSVATNIVSFLLPFSRSTTTLDTAGGSVAGTLSVTDANKYNKTVNVIVLLVAALAQWIWLDGTWSSLLAATLTFFGGPLAELPFVGHGVWDYLPSAADYLPLQQHQEELQQVPDFILEWLLGSSSSTSSSLSTSTSYSDLALSSITGPCYFAVTMDAIALGRWLEATTTTNDEAISNLEKQ